LSRSFDKSDRICKSNDHYFHVYPGDKKMKGKKRTSFKPKFQATVNEQSKHTLLLSGNKLFDYDGTYFEQFLDSRKKPSKSNTSELSVVLPCNYNMDALITASMYIHGKLNPKEAFGIETIEVNRYLSLYGLFGDIPTSCKLLEQNHSETLHLARSMFGLMAMFKKSLIKSLMRKGLSPDMVLQKLISLYLQPQILKKEIQDKFVGNYLDMVSDNNKLIAKKMAELNIQDVVTSNGKVVIFDARSFKRFLTRENIIHYIHNTFDEKPSMVVMPFLDRQKIVRYSFFPIPKSEQFEQIDIRSFLNDFQKANPGTKTDGNRWQGTSGYAAVPTMTPMDAANMLSEFLP
jgi:hypothetical protein